MLKTITSTKQELTRDTKLLNGNIYSKQYVTLADFNIGIHEVVLPAATTETWQDAENNLILIVLAGKLQLDGKTVVENTSVVAPADRKTTLTVDGQKAVHALAIVRKSVTQLDQPIISVHDQAIWEPYVEEGHVHLYLKNILLPEQIGGNIFVIDYPANHITEWHHHTFSHAIYVLDGVYVNQAESDATEQYYGPNSMVFSPQGQKMRHGAAEETDCHVLFITDEPFTLDYLSSDEVQKIEASW